MLHQLRTHVRCVIAPDGPIDLIHRMLAREPLIHGVKKSCIVFTDDGEQSVRCYDRYYSVHRRRLAMATMNPVLWLGQVFRSVAAPEPRLEEQVDELADEAADAISEYGYSRRESDLRFERMMSEMRQQTAQIRQQSAEMRQYMADLRNQIILAVLVIAATMTTVITLAIAVFD